jgi:hypothetical protein
MVNQISTLRYHRPHQTSSFIDIYDAPSSFFCLTNKKKEAKKNSWATKKSQKTLALSLSKCHFTRCDFLTRSFRRKNKIPDLTERGKAERTQTEEIVRRGGLVLVRFLSIFSKAHRMALKTWLLILPISEFDAWFI